MRLKSETWSSVTLSGIFKSIPLLSNGGSTIYVNSSSPILSNPSLRINSFKFVPKKFPPSILFTDSPNTRYFKFSAFPNAYRSISVILSPIRTAIIFLSFVKVS